MKPPSREIKINDDETPTTVITLSADPDTVTVGAGETDIKITGTINGGVFPEGGDDLEITLVLSAKSVDGAVTGTTAQRDTDFGAALTTLSIGKR